MGTTLHFGGCWKCCVLQKETKVQTKRNLCTTSQITRELLQLLQAQTPKQKEELRKNILERMERERRAIN